MAVVFTVAFVPGPPGPLVLQQIRVVHDSLLPKRTAVDLPPLSGPLPPARLEAEAESILAGRRVESLAYRWGRLWVTAHRIHGETQFPGSSVDFLLHGVPMQAFSLGRLEAIGWLRPGPYEVVVLCNCSPKKLMGFAEAFEPTERDGWPSEHPGAFPARPRGASVTPPFIKGQETDAALGVKLGHEGR